MGWAAHQPLSSPVRRAKVGPLAEGTMQTIFIMVKCDLGKAYEVADDACGVEQISEVYSTSGQYDLLMKGAISTTRPTSVISSPARSRRWPA